MPEALLAQAQSGTAGTALAIMFLVALVYLAIVRFMDLNEKEPLWAIVLVFVFGALAALILPVVVSRVTLERQEVFGPLTIEVARAVAIGIAFAVLNVVGRWRGWSEITGVLDGVVYGAAAGLGYATGDALARQLAFTASPLQEIAGPFATLFGTLLAGLIHALLGAIIGAGFAVTARGVSTIARLGAAPLAILVAWGVHVLYRILRSGGAVGGSAARTWIALAIPLIFVVAVIVLSLVRERRAIAAELEGETASGAVRDDDVRMLSTFGARRSAYMKAFFARDFDGWLALRALHNRQVMLALAKARAARETDPEEKAEAEAEVERLRAASIQMRGTLERVWGRKTATGTAS